MRSAIFGLAVGLICLGGCARPGPSGREVLLLLTIDTLRADRLGCYGDPTARTARLDRWARRGVQFAVAVAPVPLTLPSHTTILSGLVPPEHGARNNGFFRVPEDVPLVSEPFCDAGWETAAFVAAFPLAQRFGLARGFDVYRDATDALPDGTRRSRPEREAHRVNEEVFEWLNQRDPTRPLFLWTHYFDPHAPYLRHPPRRFPVRDAYAGEISFVDRQWTHLMRRLEEQFDVVRVCVTADHGESLGDHREDNHGIFVYESTTRVPLFFAGPDAPSGTLEAGPTSLTRIAPTLTEWTGVGSEWSHVESLSWAGGDASDARQEVDPRPESPEAEAEDAVYVESLLPEVRLGCAPLRGFRSARWKVIRAPEPEIYDLWTDPGELTNLYEDASALAATAPLWALLEESQRRERVALPTSVDESTEQLLASLGYVSMSPEVDGGDGALPDPKHRIELLRHVSIAKGSLAAGRLVEASQAANAALAVDPEHKETHIVLGQLEARAGHAARALEQFRHCLELPPAVSNATVYFEMGMVALQSGNAQDAEKYFGRSTRENPLNANAFFQWGQAAYALHRLADAREHWRTVVRLDPDHVAARTRLREVKSQSGANP